MTVLRTLRSEQIKLTTLRSSWWSVLLTVSASLASALLIAIVTGNDEGNSDTVETITVLFLMAAQLALIALMAMAVIVSTSEYRFGQIRMTLAATPHRWQVMLAKAVVATAVAFIVGTVTAWLCVLLAKPLLPANIRLELSDPGAMRILWGLPLYFTVAALLAMSLGAILRNSPAAITILAVMSLGVEKVLLAIPNTHKVAQYLPFNAGMRITQPAGSEWKLSPWGGFTVFCVYAVALFLVAMILTENRDA